MNDESEDLPKIVKTAVAEMVNPQADRNAISPGIFCASFGLMIEYKDTQT